MQQSQRPFDNVLWPSLWILVSTILFVAALLGCSPRVQSFPILANQGILPLSSTNPHVGANLLLGAESSSSVYLYNFLRGRGAPAAIEILQDPTGPSRLLLYYPADKQVYLGVLQIQDDRREWLVNGPYGIQRKDFRATQAIARNFGGSAPLIVAGRIERFQAPRDRLANRDTLRPKIDVPTPVPTPTRPPVQRVRKRAPAVAAADVPEPATDPDSFIPLNTDQQAIAMAKGSAERADNGDVIHTVRDEGETLAQIAAWYTGSSDNAESIGTLNGIPAEKPLVAGARIRILQRSVKSWKAMPQGSH